mmetsp:Transcript_487/g.1021  ORF Transcript_487/g.1021 Transcript_487/m.1021 type:complete len:275 (-) Transcript_487:11-835(-)
MIHREHEVVRPHSQSHHLVLANAGAVVGHVVGSFHVLRLPHVLSRALDVGAENVHHGTLRTKRPGCSQSLLALVGSRAEDGRVHALHKSTLLERLNEQSLDFVRHQLRGAEGGAGGHVERHVFVLRVGVVHLPRRPAEGSFLDGNFGRFRHLPSHEHAAIHTGKHRARGEARDEVTLLHDHLLSEHYDHTELRQSQQEPKAPLLDDDHLLGRQAHGRLEAICPIRLVIGTISTPLFIFTTSKQIFHGASLLFEDRFLCKGKPPVSDARLNAGGA